MKNKEYLVFLYQSCPQLWNKQTEKRFGRRSTEITSAYLSQTTKTTLLAVGERYGIGRERVRQIVARSLYLIERQSKYKRIQEEFKNMAGVNLLTEEEFKNIKEMLYRGEIIEDIVKQTGRSRPTIGVVAEATDWSDYGAAQRRYYHRDEKEGAPKRFMSIGDQITELVIKELEEVVQGIIRDLRNGKRPVRGGE